MSKSKFHGELDELKARVESCGLQGVWRYEDEAAKHSFRANTGEILNWWPKTGTINYQGQNKESFASAISKALEGDSLPPTVPAPSRKIFVVHGHDNDARDQLELALMRLGLQPFILQNANSKGNTIIEALEKNIYSDVGFGIVLLTPDDFGYSKTDGEEEKKPRARQNAILEMGMVMASLGRDKMAILKKGALEMPSDAVGILYIEFNDHIREVIPKLAQRLQGAGFEIGPDEIAKATT